MHKQGISGKPSAWDIFTKKARELYGTVYITREQAIESGLSLYHSGKPCKYGHDSHRYVANRVCKRCHKSFPHKEENVIQIEEGKARRKLEEKLEMLSVEKEWDY